MGNVLEQPFDAIWNGSKYQAFRKAMFSGASVNMRALENEFLGNIEDMNKFATFVQERVAAFLDLPPVEVKFKPFKMADDIQRASFDLQLNSQGKLSTRTLLGSRDHDFDAESRLLEAEAKENNRRQREQSVELGHERGGVPSGLVRGGELLDHHPQIAHDNKVAK